MDCGGAGGSGSGAAGWVVSRVAAPTTHFSQGKREMGPPAGWGYPHFSAQSPACAQGVGNALEFREGFQMEFRRGLRMVLVGHFVDGMSVGMDVVEGVLQRH